MEMLDYILNRYLGSPYSPRKLYYLCLEEKKPRTRKYADKISSAMDYGTNEDVQRAILDFMKTQKYDSMLDRNKVENWILTKDWIGEEVSDSRKIKDGNSSDNFEKWEISTADKNGNSRLVGSYYSFDEALSDYKEILERNKNSYYALDGVTDYNTHTTLMPVRYMPYYENYYGERINGLDGRVVSDSRKINDSDDEYLLQEIARQLEEGYYAGYEPQWDIDITVDGMDISEFDDYDKDLIYRDIAYVVKDGYDEYMGIQTELSDGSIVYVDFVLDY